MYWQKKKKSNAEAVMLSQCQWIHNQPTSPKDYEESHPLSSCLTSHHTSHLLCLPSHTPPQLNHATVAQDTWREPAQSPQHRVLSIDAYATESRQFPFISPCATTSAAADVITSSPDPRSDRQHLSPHAPTPTEAVTQQAGDTHGYKAPHTRRRNVPLQEKERREDESEVLQLQAKRNRDSSLVSQHMLSIIL